MRCLVISPAAQVVASVETDDCLKLAHERIGKGLDHGSLDRWHGIWVYEFGLYLPKEEQKLFSIGPMLFVGTAVVYKVDDAGETISLEEGPHYLWRNGLTFYNDWQDADRAIHAGKIVRPSFQISIPQDGVEETIWLWPNPRPK